MNFQKSHGFVHFRCQKAGTWTFLQKVVFHTKASFSIKAVTTNTRMPLGAGYELSKKSWIFCIFCAKRIKSRHVCIKPLSSCQKYHFPLKIWASAVCLVVIALSICQTTARNYFRQKQKAKHVISALKTDRRNLFFRASYMTVRSATLH